ncbi:MAG: hypothetical protein KDI39_21950, partial [Pseudomonadales bacterium]|nr:hypothetical protein [Pseudomonadales bacterium]
MPRRRLSRLMKKLLLAAVLPAFIPAFSADWNQWRGPGRNGVSQDTTPIAEKFPDEGMKQVWESGFIPSNEYGGHG